MVQGPAARWHVQVLPIRQQKEELTSLLLPVEHTTAHQDNNHPTILQVIANQGLSINQIITITVIHALHVLLLQVTMTEEPLEAEVQETRAIALQGVHPL